MVTIERSENVVETGSMQYGGVLAWSYLSQIFFCKTTWKEIISTTLVSVAVQLSQKQWKVLSIPLLNETKSCLMESEFEILTKLGTLLEIYFQSNVWIHES